MDPRWIRPDELSGPPPGEPAGPVRLSMLKGAYSREACCARSWLAASCRVSPVCPNLTPALAMHLMHRSARCQTSPRSALEEPSQRDTTVGPDLGPTTSAPEHEPAHRQHPVTLCLYQRLSSKLGPRLPPVSTGATSLAPMSTVMPCVPGSVVRTPSVFWIAAVAWGRDEWVSQSLQSSSPWWPGRDSTIRHQLGHGYSIDMATLTLSIQLARFVRGYEAANGTHASARRWQLTPGDDEHGVGPTRS